MLGDTNNFRPVRHVDRALALDAEAATANAERIFGDPGFFDSWRRVKVFDMAGLVAPFALEVRADDRPLDFAFDSCSVAIAWDDATIFEGGPVELQEGEAGRHAFRINAIRGRSLEVWAAGFDAFGDAAIITLTEAARRDTEGVKPPETPAADSFASMTKALTILIPLAVVGAILLFAAKAAPD